MVKTRKIPRGISALLLVEHLFEGFCSVFATLVHGENKPWRLRTNPDTRAQSIERPVGRGDPIANQEP